MLINNEKQIRQNAAIDKWIARGGIGTFQWVTGAGKTYIAILIIKRLLKNDANAVINVVVPTLKLKQDWTGYTTKDTTTGKKIKVAGHIDIHNLKNVNVYVINSYIKKANHDCKLLIIDKEICLQPFN